MKLTVKANAKVNLFLDITGKRTDGYHVLDTVMMSVGLCDKLVLEERSYGIKIYCDDKTIPCDERNLCFKAAKIFFEKTGVDSGITIRLKKRIPSEAGLGGGSADAAAVLAGMAKLFSVDVDSATLRRMAAAVGADVPFCIEGGCLLLGGAGDEPIMELPLPRKYLLIIKPKCGISTPEAYRTLDMIHGNFSKRRKDSWSLVQLLDKKKKFGSEHIFNIFEEVLPTLAPECDAILSELRMTANSALLCGSGTAVFGLFDRKKDRDEAFVSFSEKYENLSIFKAEPKASGLEFAGEDYE